MLAWLLMLRIILQRTKAKNKTNIFHAELQTGYVVNPATNLKLFAYLSYRNFNPEAETESTFKNSTVWFSLGLRTDLFNWYFDF